MGLSVVEDVVDLRHPLLDLEELTFEPFHKGRRGRSLRLSDL
jgi:hypothetical protein